MQQVEQYVHGERDYAKIKGDTGPLVYPAAHVYIYRILFALTDEGRDIRLAQVVFAILYLFSLAMAMLCYRQAKVDERCAIFPEFLHAHITIGAALCISTFGSFQTHA